MMNKEKYYTYQLNMKILNFLAILLLALVGVIIYFLECHDPYVVHFNTPTLILLMIFWLVFHELLHAVGFIIFKSVKPSKITLGIALEKGILYCMCKQPIPKKVILTSLLFPFTIIGVITLGIGMWINHFELVYLSILNIVSSIGDLVMTYFFIKTPKDIIYLDLDDCTSFTVVSKANLQTIKVWGVELITEGEYHEKTLRAHDKRKIIISKPSWYIIIFILILTIIEVVGGFL